MTRDWRKVGKRIRSARKDRSLTQAALAEVAGISTRHMSFIETGRSRPGRQVLLELAAALALTPRQSDGLLEAAGYARASADMAPAKTRYLTTAQELQALADPLRLELLRLFGKTPPLSPRMAADRLAIPATRVYHHVQVLAEAGLIELVETRPRRGATEKYYRTTASSFHLKPGLVSGSGDDAASRAAAEIIETLLADLRELEIEKHTAAEQASELVVMRSRLRLTEAAMAELIGELTDLLRRYAAPAEVDAVTYQMTVVGIPGTKAGVD